MNLNDFRDLLNYIEKNHSFRRGKGKMIKYVSPTCDMRSGDIFHINLRQAGNGVDFSLTNENKDRNLKRWVMDWLDNGEWRD